MEEDSSMEWSEIEEEDKPSGESKLSLIWKRGWRLGKKIVITGVAISSAPFVLPPLMVVSTLGFAFAVPFGFVFGSYVCTEKLMSKLLSSPNPSLLMLEPKIEEEFMDEGEKEFIDDTKDTLEMRIELIGDEKMEEENEGFDVEEEEEPLIKGVMEEEEEETRDNGSSDNYVEMEKPVIEYVSDVEEEKLKRGIMGVIGEFGDEVKIDETLEEEEPPVMGDIEEDKKPVGETREAIEEIGDEENVGNALEDEQKMVEAYVDDIEEDEKPVTEMNGGEESRGEGNGVQAIEEEKIEEEGKPVTETNGVVEEGKDEKYGNIMVMVEEEDIPVQDMEGVRVGVGEKQLEVVMIEEGKVFVRETAGIVEENRDVKPLDENITEDEKHVEDIGVAVEMGDEQDVYDVSREETYIAIEEKPVVDKNGVVEEEWRDGGEHVGDVVVEENSDNDKGVKPFNGTGVIEESIGDENVDKSTEVEDIPIEDKSIGEAMKIAKERRDHESVDRSLNEGGKPVEEMGGRMEHRRDGKNVDGSVMAERKGVIYGKGELRISDSMVEEEKKPIVEKEKKVLSSKAEDAREIAAESGLYFFDEDNADKQAHPKHGSAVEKGYPSDNLKEIADSVAHPVSSEVAQSAKGSFEEENTNPSKEVMYIEGKIWERIDAMRKIVGYKADVQPTCLEEVKALYVFTGVEPPLTFRDPSDLAEINNKLQLLMSIVGVK